MEKLTKSQVIARVKRQGSLTIELYPSNCGPSNQVWVQGIEVELVYEDGEVVQRTMEPLSFTTDGGATVMFEEEKGESFETAINSFMYYNCNAQLGKRVHYYVKP